jgi:hypothetical protein
MKDKGDVGKAFSATIQTSYGISFFPMAYEIYGNK